MNYLSVENVGKTFGDRMLFQNISFGINKDQKIAFVAKNGVGKTTLLNIIADLETADEGQVIKRKDISIGYLSQKNDLNPNLSIEETIFNTDNPTLKIIEAYELALQNPEDSEAYQQAFDKMDQVNAWDFETQYKQILFKLKLEQLDQKVGNLSGGQQKRLALAIVLLKRPDLLILDEPTNHLDLEMIEWLESYFIKEKVTLFMVTHDRYFLERVCNEIIELDEGEIFKYTGNYSYFLEKKELRLEIEKVTLSKAKSLFKKELDWMRRQPKARTTKSKSRIDDFYKIKEQAHKKRNDHIIQLELNMERLGSKIVELHNVGKTFGDLTVLKHFDYIFKKGERIGIIGVNGSGKSTLLNLITQNLTPDTGKVVIGDTVKIGYYTQDGIHVKPGQKVIEVIREFGEFIPLKKGKSLSAGNLLERFLFDRKKQYDFVEKLSGGELKRLFLCTVLIQNPNFLILDEPTNDLDIVTLNILESFLLDFPGNILIVSHDRYFMDKIIDHLFVLEDGLISDFPGDYSSYRVYKDSEIKISTKEKKSDSRIADKKTAISYKEQKEFKQIEKDIDKLNQEKKKIEQAFVDGIIPEDEMFEKGQQLEEIIKTIEDKEERWLEISMLMEE